MAQLTALFLLLAALSAGSSAADLSPFSGAAHVPHQLLVKFFDDVPEEIKQRIRSKLGVIRIEPIESIGVEHWVLPQETGVSEAVALLESEAAVAYAEPNLLYRPNVVPDDSLFGELWHLYNTGQTVNGLAGTPGADISAPAAWALETGSRTVVIAVIDSGVALDHPDLKDNIWTNAGEVAKDGIDNDRNGYVDDVHGWDFVNADNDPSDYSRDLYGDGHGTHVAGTIAASGGNRTGIAGVMWRAGIMPLQVFDLFGTRSFLEATIQLVNLAVAIEYAVKNGARVINASFGAAVFSRTLYDSIAFAGQNGVVFVASAGNEGADTDTVPSYPASYDLDNIISVAATDAADDLASYSNFGVFSVDVGAPGGGGASPGILSTIPPKRVELFSEDFESGLGRWRTQFAKEPWSTGTSPLFESRVATDSVGSYASGESSSIVTVDPIQVGNAKGLSLEFKIYFDLEPNADYWYMDLSEDGVNFSTAYLATGYSLGTIEFQDWKAKEDFQSLYLRFRLVTDGDVNRDGVYMDDIRLTGIPWVFVGDEYGYKSGTSMAAPVVSGIAGLVWSAAPAMGHLEVKAAILGSVDPLPSLAGRVLTGGRVNARRALEAALDDDQVAPSGAAVSDSGEEEDGCFVAASACGAGPAARVRILKEYRGRFLVDSGFGCDPVCEYLAYSPPLAKVLLPILVPAAAAAVWPFRRRRIFRRILCSGCMDGKSRDATGCREPSSAVGSVLDASKRGHLPDSN